MRLREARRHNRLRVPSRIGAAPPPPSLRSAPLPRRGVPIAVARTECRAPRRGAPGPGERGPPPAPPPLDGSTVRHRCGSALAARIRNAPHGSPSGTAPLTPPTSHERLHSMASGRRHHSTVSRVAGSRSGDPCRSRESRAGPTCARVAVTSLPAASGRRGQGRPTSL